MVNQITPAGSVSVPLAGAALTPVAARVAPTRSPVPQVLGLGNQPEAVAQVNQHLQQTQTDLKLQVDAASGRTVFQVVQQGTGEVVLQVPSEEVLGMSRRMRALAGQREASGALVDKEG